MARVIEIDQETETRIVHDECGALIGYVQTDIKKLPKVEGMKIDYYYIVCPNCGKKIFL